MFFEGREMLVVVGIFRLELILLGEYVISVIAVRVVVVEMKNLCERVVILKIFKSLVSFCRGVSRLLLSCMVLQKQQLQR